MPTMPQLTRQALADPMTLLGGMPFLDDTFLPRRLLAGAAAVRQAEAQRNSAKRSSTPQGLPPEAWLQPSAIYTLRDSPPMPARPLTRARRTGITAALDATAALIPGWGPLLRLPVRYARLYPDRGAISASSRAWQQHVLLAEAAFVTETELREQVLHELAHQWLYLMQELWRLEEPDAPPVTLPSGTGGRSPAEALGAAHVAAVLIRLYRVTGDHDRVCMLAGYGAGCLERAQHLTPAGARIAERLTHHLIEEKGARS